MPVHMCLYMCVCTQAYIGRCELSSSIIFSFTLRQSLMNLDSVGLADQPVLGILLPLPTQCWDCRHTHCHAWLFVVVVVVVSDGI